MEISPTEQSVQIACRNQSLMALLRDAQQFIYLESLCDPQGNLMLLKCFIVEIMTNSHFLLQNMETEPTRIESDDDSMCLLAKIFTMI